MDETIKIIYEEITEKYYVYHNENLIGKNYTFQEVLKQLNRETENFKVKE